MKLPHTIKNEIFYNNYVYDFTCVKKKKYESCSQAFSYLSEPLLDWFV